MSLAPRSAVGLVAASLALLLAACSGSRPAPPACPSVLLLKGAERTAGYRTTASPRPADLEHLAVLKNLVSVCRYDETGVDLALRFELIAEQGPAYGGSQQLELSYFVATLSPDLQVLSKPVYPSEVVFEEGRKVAGNTIDLTLRLPGVGPADGGLYRVYVGFQLDDRELERRLQSR